MIPKDRPRPGKEKTMKIYQVTDPEFRPYGVVHGDFPVEELLEELRKTPIGDGVTYTALEESLQSLPVAKLVQDHLFGGMPVELGWCNGHNRTMNCLEYHRDSELNLGSTDFILLVALREQIRDGKLDSSAVKAFHVPAGLMVEVFAATLHYAPCHVEKKGFQVMIGLPMGTNMALPEIEKVTWEDGLLMAKNKWLLAHPLSDEAKNGAYVGICGENVTLGELD